MIATSKPARPAVFLDRDGTLIEFVDYLADPALVRLVDGAGEVLRRINAAGFACVLVTNQAGVGRGFFPESAVHAVHDALANLLAAEDVTLDGIYYCPAAPAPAGVDDHPDRKPNPGMLLRAARDLNLDLAASWMVGDAVTDVHAGLNAGCRGNILLQSGKFNHDLISEFDGDPRCHLVADFRAAAELILARCACGTTMEAGRNGC